MVLSTLVDGDTGHIVETNDVSPGWVEGFGRASRGLP